MAFARQLLALCIVVFSMTSARHALAWIENHVLGDEVTVRVDRDGKAQVEHRLSFHTNGNVRFREYVLQGIEDSAVPLPNSYIVPAKHALASSLDSATPLTLEVVRDESSDASGAFLKITVADEKGVRRGRYLMVLRYQVDLAATDRIRRDGAFLRVTWDGPQFEDGFDNARTTFSVPRAPTPPRAVDASVGEDEGAGDDGTVPIFLAEVRRGDEADEVELLRTYAAKGESVRWAVRVDPRALERVPVALEEGTAEPRASPPPTLISRRLVALDRRAGLIAGLLFLLCAVLVWWKSREVVRLCGTASAEMPPLVPLPGWARGVLSGGALIGGLALQLVLDQAVAGATASVVAALLATHRPPRVVHATNMRGPGRWLAVSEREALEGLPRPMGGWLDVSTLRGKVILTITCAGIGFVAWRMWPVARWHALMIAGNVVVPLAILGTGLGRSLPPDLMVEPARFLRRVFHRLRRRRDLKAIRVVPRIRIPTGGVDPDEVRLLIAPRVPLRGFTAIEIGLTYAVGMGARVAMPEVLLRVVAGSDCDRAIAAISKVGRVTTGRKRDERVIAFSPRFPTVRMTTEIAAALAIRVLDREATPRAKRPDSQRAEESRAA